VQSNAAARLDPVTWRADTQELAGLELVDANIFTGEPA
jgi:hypothetical protein